MAAPTDVWAFLLGSTNFSLLFDYDGNGNQIYVGWAQPGTLSSSPTWRIMQENYNGSNQQTSVKWPNASTGFAFVWDNRTTYSYS